MRILINNLLTLLIVGLPSFTLATINPPPLQQEGNPAGLQDLLNCLAKLAPVTHSTLRGKFFELRATIDSKIPNSEERGQHLLNNFILRNENSLMMIRPNNSGGWSLHQADLPAAVTTAPEQNRHFFRVATETPGQFIYVTLDQDPQTPPIVRNVPGEDFSRVLQPRPIHSWEPAMTLVRSQISQILAEVAQAEQQISYGDAIGEVLFHDSVRRHVLRAGQAPVPVPYTPERPQFMENLNTAYTACKSVSLSAVQHAHRAVGQQIEARATGPALSDQVRRQLGLDNDVPVAPANRLAPPRAPAAPAAHQ